MILFCNTLITETKPPIGKGFVFRENLKSFSNFDIFKYSLASLAVAYDWSKVILKISLDDVYKHRQQELEEFIKEEFSKFNLILEWERNVYQNDWKKSYELLDDNLIWFYCNHDHIFFDSSTDYLDKVANDIKNKEKFTLLFSHFPECIRTINQGLKSEPLHPYTDPSYEINNDYLSIKSEGCDSIQIITKDVYYSWWFEGDFNNIKLPRPDYFGICLNQIKPMMLHTTAVPIKEICRHFDGYQHIMIPITNNQCPAIEIPPGFFENDIKIRYGYDDYKEGWVNINPKNNYYYAYDKSGTDYKFTLNDLPLVWKSRISIIDSNPNINEEEILQYRLKSILETIYTSDLYPVEDKIKDKVLKEYMKCFPNYQLYA